MSTLNLPSFSQLVSLIIANYKAVRPTADDGPYSDLWLGSRILARIEARAMKAIQRTLDALFPLSTWGDYLDRWLSFVGESNGSGGYGLVIPRGSGPITAALAVTATGATVDLDGYQLTDDAGLVYEIDQTYAFGGAGTANLTVKAISTGRATNLESGDTLTFSSPPANVVSAATLVKKLTGAADQETDPEGRSRLKTRMQTPPASGNWPDWVETIEKASPGDVRGFVWMQRQSQPFGFGYVDYCGLRVGEVGEDRAILSTDDLYTDIANAITDRMPILAMRGSRQLTMVAVNLVIDITITTHPSATGDQLCDWDAEALKTHVDSVTEGSKLFNCHDNVTAYLSVDDRVIVDGYELTVNAVGVAGGLADDSCFTVSEAWPYTGWNPAGKYVLSGGGVIKIVLDAERAYADGLGPARGTYAAPITTWQDSLLLLWIQATAIQAADGTAVDVDVNLPAVDMIPTAGSGATTQFICVTEVRVWEAK